MSYSTQTYLIWCILHRGGRPDLEKLGGKENAQRRCGYWHWHWTRWEHWEYLNSCRAHPELIQLQGAWILLSECQAFVQIHGCLVMTWFLLQQGLCTQPLCILCTIYIHIYGHFSLCLLFCCELYEIQWPGCETSHGLYSRVCVQAEEARLRCRTGRGREALGLDIIFFSKAAHAPESTSELQGSPVG